MKYIILDWCGNILDYTKIFKPPELSVALEFDSFDDTLEYIDLYLDDCREDIFIEEI